MRRLSLPPQIVRLVLLTVGIVVVFLTARYFLVPPSFGMYGFYRGEALEEAASREPVYAGKNACTICHPDQVETLEKFEHKTLSCESCHGLCNAHAQNPDVDVNKQVQTRCVRCHEASPSRPAWFVQITANDHYTGERCVECHLPHHPKEAPALSSDDTKKGTP